MIPTFTNRDSGAQLEGQQEFRKAVAFINSIGIKTQYKKLDPASFLPGLSIEAGVIVIDVEALQYPGDILHEAGHLAVIPAAERGSMNATAIAQRPEREAEEMMSICWSYAACVHLQLPASFVFHEDGYKSGGSSIAENFLNKQYVGLPMLQWVGMAYDEKNAAANQAAPYPAMIKWLRD